MKKTLFLVACFSTLIFSCKHHQNEPIVFNNLCILLYDLSQSVVVKGEGSIRHRKHMDSLVRVYLESKIINPGDVVVLAFIGGYGANLSHSTTFDFTPPINRAKGYNSIEKIVAERQSDSILQVHRQMLVRTILDKINSQNSDAMETGILESFPLIQNKIEYYPGYSTHVCFVSDMIQESPALRLVEKLNGIVILRINSTGEIPNWVDTATVILSTNLGISTTFSLSCINEVTILSPCYLGSSVNCPYNMAFVDQFWQKLFLSYEIKRIQFGIE